MSKMDKIKTILNLLKPKQIDLSMWSDEDLRTLAAIQNDTGCDPDKLSEEDKQELDRLTKKYFSNE